MAVFTGHMICKIRKESVLSMVRLFITAQSNIFDKILFPWLNLFI